MPPGIFGRARASFENLESCRLESIKVKQGQPNYDLLRELVVTMRSYYRFFGAAFGLIMLLGGGTWILV